MLQILIETILRQIQEDLDLLDEVDPDREIENLKIVDHDVIKVTTPAIEMLQVLQSSV